MKYIIAILVLVSTLIPSISWAIDYSDYEDEAHKIVITRDPENHPKRSYADTRTDYNYGDVYRAVDEYNSLGGKGDELILYVNATLYPEIQNKLLNTYVPSVENDGWNVTVKTISGGDEVDLRNTMISDYGNLGYFHGILIGDLPIPWFYIEEDFGDPHSATFPVDLYYMDIDGEWRDDLLSDGIFDYHEDGTGDIEADIPIARWTTSTLTYGYLDEAELIENYIDKNIAYRNGQMIPTDDGLAYIDDDWSSAGPSWGGAVNTAFPGTEIVYDIYDTNAEDYESNRLPTSYEHILACVHSYSGGHAWHVGEDYSWTTASDLHYIKSHSVSYNMFACSNSLFTENNYMGGWYCFMDNEWGVFSIGCTKSGSMLNFEQYYSPLSAGKTYGRSFQEWFAANAEYGAGGQNYSRSWFYGMTINGDPTLYTLEYTTNVVLSSFWAEPHNDSVTLNWEYSDDGEDVGFNLYRRTVPRDTKGKKLSRETLDVRLNDGLIVGESPITYVDENAAFDAEYEYRLEMVVNSSVKDEATAYAQTSPPVKTVFGLTNVFPNPARGEVAFEYVIPENSAGVLSIFDISGRRVYSIDISDSQGIVKIDTDIAEFDAITNGLYIARLAAGDKIDVKKFVIAR